MICYSENASLFYSIFSEGEMFMKATKNDGIYILEIPACTV